MFLAERLFGASLYVCLLLIVCYIIFRARFKYTRPVLLAYLACISAMAFFYVPYITADLYRITQYMNQYAMMPVSDVWAALAETNTPVTFLYLRIIGLTGIEGLLAGVTTFIVFWNVFYIIRDYAKRLQQPKAVALALFALMSTGFYMQTVGGIRNMLAFSILARCFYDEICNQKKVVRNIAWYIIACLIHPAAIAAVALRLVALLYAKISTGGVKSLLVAISSLSLASILVMYLGGETYINNAIIKLEGYTTEIEYNYLWDNIITALTIILIGTHYKLYSYYHKKPGVEHLKWLISFSLLVMMFSLVFFFEHATFVRFTQLNLIIMLPVIMSNIDMVMSRAQVPTPNVAILHRIVLYIPVLILVISASRGALSSLKFFVL